MGVYADTTNIVDGQRIDAADVTVPIEALDAQIVINTASILTNAGSITTLTTLIADLRSGSQAMASPDINGGTIDDAVIGGSVRAAGNFTTINTNALATLSSLTTSSATITGGTIDGTPVGATTATTVKATTVSAGGATSTVVIGNGDDTLNVRKDSGTNAYNTFELYSDTGRVVIGGKRAKGSIASPTMPTNGIYLLEIEANGWDSDGFMRWTAGILFKAAENWTASSKATQIEFSTTNTGSETRTLRWTIDPAGKLVSASSPTWTAATTTVNRAAVTNATTLANLAQAVGTMINDLKALGLFI